MSLKEEILGNVKVFLGSADKLYKDKDYTSSSVLYCKCLFAVLDYILLNSGLGTPKDHNERFRILQSRFPSLYIILDKIFPIYQKTYSTSVDKETCDFIVGYVK